MPRLSKADQNLVDEATDTFGFTFEEPPARQRTRHSKYFDMWEAAKNVCRLHPGKTLKVRTYTSSASAYNDAKAVNNCEKANFVDEQASDWTAVATQTGTDEWAIYLTYNGE